MPADTKGIFSSNAFTYTWTTAMDDTINLADIIFPNPPKEVGLHSLYLFGTGSVTVTPTFQYKLSGSVYSPVLHSLSGLTNGTATEVTSFTPANGFECRLDTQNFFKYNERGYRIVLTRASSVEVVFTYGMVSFI